MASLGGHLSVRVVEIPVQNLPLYLEYGVGIDELQVSVPTSETTWTRGFTWECCSSQGVLNNRFGLACCTLLRALAAALDSARSSYMRRPCAKNRLFSTSASFR